MPSSAVMLTRGAVCVMAAAAFAGPPGLPGPGHVGVRCPDQKAEEQAAAAEMLQEGLRAHDQGLGADRRGADGVRPLRAGAGACESCAPPDSFAAATAGSRTGWAA